MNRQPEPVLSMSCPQPGCERSADVIDRFTLWSTDGEILHLKTRCGHRHWFTIPVEPVSIQTDRLSRVIAPAGTPSGVSPRRSVGRQPVQSTR